MTNTQTAAEVDTAPHDPAMASASPAMFAPITPEENSILRAHLTSGWYKQAAVYPTLSEPWRETYALLNDLHDAHRAAHQARQQARQATAQAEAGPEPEAGS